MDTRVAGRPALLRTMLIIALVLIGFVILTLLDKRIYDLVHWPRESKDLHRMFRVLGYLPMVAVLAGGIAVIDRVTGARAAILMLISSAVGGAGAELVKMIVGRERPEVHDGMYVFKPFLTGFTDHSNLAFPSSHVATAFGAAWMLCLIYPRGRWLWLGLAAGCAWTRIAAEAHFATDCYAGAVLSYLAALLVWRIACRRGRDAQTAPPIGSQT
ncbi:MAG: phosphatase PAP2 family protein [Phycisphaerales bacterium]|nr:phosphatase PAP2 family protein [Phycisphaerales bacterium]